MTREDIDDIINIICPKNEDFEKPCISPAYLRKELETLALEQEPNTKKDLGVDCISREQASEPYKILENTDTLSVYTIRQNLAELPSVTPQEPKTGHWIYDRTRDWDGECKYECSCCGMGSDVDYAYCMRCGAKMERNDKE